LVIRFDALLDFFQLLDFHAIARFRDAVVEKDVAITVATEGFDFSEDFLGGHRIVFQRVCHSGRKRSNGYG